MGRRREYEAPDVGAMVSRMLRALVRRAADGDTEALEELVRLEAESAVRVKEAGRALHTWGYSYTELAPWMGSTRQAVRQRLQRQATGE